MQLQETPIIQESQPALQLNPADIQTETSSSSHIALKNTPIKIPDFLQARGPGSRGGYGRRRRDERKRRINNLPPQTSTTQPDELEQPEQTDDDTSPKEEN